MEVEEEVEGIVVEIEGTVVEGEVEAISATGVGIDCYSDTMKRINLSLKNCNNGVHTVKTLRSSLLNAIWRLEQISRESSEDVLVSRDSE
nr:hypothetical protein CFP56_38664 [Quercus suber]